MQGRREVQRKAEIGEDACEIDYSHDTPPVKYIERRIERPASSTQDDLQKKILEILNKKPIMQQIAKKVEVKPKPMTPTEKEDLKHKLLQDDKIKAAMNALRNSKRLSK